MIPNYSPTPEDRDAIACMDTDRLLAIVSVQLVPQIVEIMVDELNARYTAEFDAAYADEIDDFARELDALLAELSSLDVFTVEDEELDVDVLSDEYWAAEEFDASDFWAADDFYGDDEENWF